MAAVFSAAAICGPRATPSRVAAAEAALNCRISDFRADDEPLVSVLNRLQSLSTVPFNVDWDSLQKLGITPDKRVTCRLRTLYLSKIISVVLPETADADDSGQIWDRACQIDDDGSIHITTEDDPTRFVQRTYDVRDFLEQYLDAISALPPPPGYDGASSLEKLIADTVDSYSWKINGGKYATIELVAGYLKVTTTQQSQRKVAKLLEQLRDENAVFFMRRLLSPLGEPLR